MQLFYDHLEALNDASKDNEQKLFTLELLLKHLGPKHLWQTGWTGADIFNRIQSSLAYEGLKSFFANLKLIAYDSSVLSYSKPISERVFTDMDLKSYFRDLITLVKKVCIV